MRVNSGADHQATVMGGGIVGETGTATATTGTSLTSNSTVVHVANDLVGHWLIATTPNPPVFGLITANTAGTNTILTVDRWVVPGTINTGATPGATTNYAILQGGPPANWIALSTNATAPAATDTALTGEMNNVNGGLNRAKATYSHTIGSTSYSLSNTFTANSNDGLSNTIQKIGIGNSGVPTGGQLVFESAVPNPPTLVPGDTVQITDTINI